VAGEEFGDHYAKSVCLVAECEYPEDREEIRPETAPTIFNEELSAWHLDSAQHREFTDSELFHSWFETEFFEMVADALDESLIKSQ